MKTKTTVPNSGDSSPEVIQNGHSSTSKQHSPNSSSKSSSSSSENGVKMSIADETILPLSDSFWEIGQYKRTVKRIDDGLTLCHQLMALIKERGDIEATYAKSLKSWSKKWYETIEKGPEYGTMEAAWKGVLEESDKKCDLHLRIRDRLIEEVYNTVKVWQKENYHQKALTGIKESREVEDAFKKAQKPWAKLYSNADKRKKEFHVSCKAERTAINQEKNSQGDSSVSADQIEKLQERVQQCLKKREASKDVYDKGLNELNSYNGKYMEDMTMVFEKCQEMELKRLKFFKEMLFGIHKCLDVTQDPKLSAIYREYWGTVDMADAQQDLRLWSQSHGIAMPMNWPVFEDYAEDLHSISRVPKTGNVAANTIQLKGVNAQKFRQEFVEYSPELKRINKKELKDHNQGGSGVQLLKQTITNPVPSTSTNGEQKTSTEQNGRAEKTLSKDSVVSNGPFEDDWDNTNDDATIDDGSPGVQVKALYDYAAQEDDELNLCKGDIFEKIESEDEQGWCKGRKDGRVGLYPANYASAV